MKVANRTKAQNPRRENVDPTDVQAFEQINRNVAVYEDTRDQISNLNLNKGELRETILADTRKIGNRDHKGNIVAHTADFEVTAQRRQKVTFDDEAARQCLTAKGIAVPEKTIVVIDQEAILLLVEQGKISTLELEAMYDKGDETYALIVKASGEEKTSQ